jgi:hypothetical protein
MDNVLYSSEFYEVAITTITEESGNELVVYGVFNKETGVREAELRGYAHAIQWANTLSEQITKVFTETSSEDAIKNALGESGIGQQDQTEVASEPLPIDPAEAVALVEGSAE